MAADCWSTRNIQPLLFQHLAYRVDLPETKPFPLDARYPALEPLRRLEIRQNGIVEEIGRTSEEDEAKIRLLLYLLAGWVDGGAPSLRARLEYNYGVKEDIDKPANLKKAVRILDGVDKTEELLP